MLRIAHDIIYRHPLEKNHRFPMEKYDLIPLQLIKEKTCNFNNFFIPKNLNDQDVLNTHDKKRYLESKIRMAFERRYEIRTK